MWNAKMNATDNAKSTFMGLVPLVSGSGLSRGIAFQRAMV